jgi:hypothetical protein
MAYTTPQLEQILEEAGWPEQDIPNAIGVIGAESGGNNDPPNYAGATGIFQVLQDHWQGLNWNVLTPGAPKDEATYTTQLETNPIFNAQQALQLFDAEGWEPWETDSFVQGNPQILDNPTASANGTVTVPGIVSGQNVGGGTVTQTTSGAISAGTANAQGSAVASAMTRIVLGIVGIILLAICVDQLFHDNTPAQTIIQGGSNTVGRTAKTGKKVAAVAPFVAA